MCSWRALAALPLALALLIYQMPTLLDEYEAWYGYGQAPMFDLPPGVMDQFRVYDSNGDGFIDPYEFAVLGLRLREEASALYYQSASVCGVACDCASHVSTVCRVIASTLRILSSILRRRWWW